MRGASPRQPARLVLQKSKVDKLCDVPAKMGIVVIGARRALSRQCCMISNERPSSYGPWSYPSGPRPRVQEDTLKPDKAQIECKTICFTLNENLRGSTLPT